MRLTKKELMSAINQPVCFGSRLVGKKMFAQIIKELCEYKTIEEELGIDLITLYKAYINGFHIKYEDGLRGFVKGGEYFLEICLETKAFKVKAFPDGTKWYFKDYGKTWALTKEELD